MNRKKLIYSILKELEQGNKPNRADYELEMEQWGEIAELIIKGELASDITVTRAGIGHKVIGVLYSKAKIGLKGLDYLEENSTLAKTYKGLKELRDWLKL